MSILKPTRDELQLCELLRSKCIEDINKIGVEEASKFLGLLPTGVTRLITKSEWTLNEAVRTTELLGFGLIKGFINLGKYME